MMPLMIRRCRRRDAAPYRCRHDMISAAAVFIFAEMPALTPRYATYADYAAMSFRFSPRYFSSFSLIT